MPCSSVGSRMVAKSACVVKPERIHRIAAKPRKAAGGQPARVDAGRRCGRPRATARSPAAPPAPSPARPRWRCSPCTAAATAAAARCCRRSRRRPRDSDSVPIRKLRRANSRRSTTGCAAPSSHTRKNMKPTADQQRQHHDLGGLEPVELRPWSTMTCSAPTHSTSRHRPTRSSGTRCGGWARSRYSDQVSAAAPRPTGMLM